MAVSFTLEHRFPGPRKEVFDAHLDVDHFSDWMIGCTGIEKLTDGPVGAGTAWRETRELPPNMNGGRSVLV